MTKVVSLMAVAILYVASTASVVANQNDAVILYLNDPLGSAIAAYDENGDVCWEETHTPYGDKTVLDDSFNRPSCGVIIEERGFTGHTDDYETDLVYMQQRYYDPTVGRFLSTDPVGPVVGMSKSTNRYSYGGNNPYKYVDPDGQFLVSGFIAAVTLATVVHSAYVGYQEGGIRGAIEEGTGYNAAKESVNAFASGDYSGAVILAAGVAIKPVRAVDKIVPEGGMTDLYRAVGPDELADIKDTGKLINRGSAEGKYFTTSSEHASDYAKQAVNGFKDPPYTTVKTQVPTSSLPNPVSVDGGIPAYVVPNQSLGGLKPEVLNSMAIPK